MAKKKPNNIMAIYITEKARGRLDQVIAKLKNDPPVPELGCPTIKSIVSAAIIEGLDVLAARYGLED